MKLDQQLLNQPPMQQIKVKQNPYFLWEQHNITLIKSQNFGYGIAISGGLSNTNQDASIYISDIVPGGPAENKLLVDDIILSVNGVNVENVEHAFVIRLLKEAKDFIHLVIKRKLSQPTQPNEYVQTDVKRHNVAIAQTAATVMANYQNSYQNGLLHSVSSNSTSTTETPNQNLMSIMMNSTQSLSSMKPFKVQLSRKEKKELFGIVLGCKFYIKDILPHSIAAHETNLKKGDILLKLNDLNTEQISLVEANKILTKYKDNKLNLLIKRSNLSDDEDVAETPEPKQEECVKSDAVDAQKPDAESEPSRGVKFFSNKNLVLNYRNVIFARENGIGIRLAGGNKVGIFICDVQYNSPAERAGLKIGDKIIKVNGIDYTSLTREEAVQHILAIQNMVEMVVANSPEEYEPNAFDPLGGDSFYIRTHFNLNSKNSSDLEFRINDILHVTDTLYNGVIGQWVASRLDKHGEGGEETKGTIPNKVNAEQLVQTASTIEQLYSTSEKQSEPSSTFSLGASARMSIRMKLSGRNTLSKRSKSATRSNNENEQSVKVSKANTFYSNKFNAYERVVLKEVNFARPIVIFGPLADVAREKLKNEFPNKYEIPECYSTDPDNTQSSGVIKLASIKSIIEKGRHCLLDITPNAVDHLNYAQYYPICVYLKAQSRNHTKDLRQKYAKNLKTKSSKRLYENSVKLETYYSHLFTATIQLESNQWFKKLKELVDAQQTQPIWISQESEPKVDTPKQEAVVTPQQNEIAQQQQFMNKQLLIKSEPQRYVFDDNFEFPIYTTANPTISGAASTYSLYEENDFNRCSFAASDPDINSQQQVQKNLQNESFSQIYSTNFNNKPPYQAENNAMSRVKSDPNLNQDLYVKAQITYGNAVNAQNYQIVQENQDNENWKKFATYSANTLKNLENGSSPIKSVSNTPTKCRPGLNDAHFSDQFKRLSTNEGYERNSGYKLIKSSQSNLMPNTNKSIIDQQINGESFEQDNNSLLLKPIHKHDQIDHMAKHQIFKQELDNKLKNDLKCKSTNQSMKTSTYNTEIATLRRGHKESPSRPPPPILPKPKFILPQTSTTNLVLQRNLKSKSELNIATPSNFSSSSAACSSSSSTSSNSSQTANDIHMEPEPRPIQPNAFQQQKPRNKLLENNSLISSSQGYQSDTWESHSSRQSFDLDSQFNGKYSKNLIKPIQELKKINNGSTSSSDDTENENGHFIKKSILLQKPASSSCSTVSTSSNSSSSAVGLTNSATISEESIKKRMSNDGFEIPVYFQATNGAQNDLSSMSSSSNSYYFNQQNNTNQKYSDLYSSDSVKSRVTNTYTAHYNDNGIYRKLSLDSNSNCSIIASANGIFDTNGGILESADTGVSLNVPEGAIANGCSFDLYFKVCHCKSTITNGKGEILSNPIVMCGPRGIRFLKPIELQIPHFISIDGQSWSYAFKTQESISEDEDPYNWNANRFHKKTLINSVTVQLESF